MKMYNLENQQTSISMFYVYFSDIWPIYFSISQEEYFSNLNVELFILWNGSEIVSQNSILWKYFLNFKCIRDEYLC